ncbi:MAG: FIST C-terminal domain-containing protein [Defluviitaleaceae bacterium]|nr:FIST C-terminal domain-containing protein [Defluviitaleaceae bacterium]
MLKCAGVYTCEVDDAEAALSEINTRLNDAIVLMENTVGVIMCHPEFVQSGVLRYICDRLPFDIAGATTSSQAVNGIAEDMVLTVFVMTADDVTFRTGITETLTEDIFEPTRKAYEAVEIPSSTPRLALIFAPLLSHHAGDDYVDAWERVIPGVPVFGMMCTDDTVDFSESAVIYNGQTKKDAMPYILCYGNIRPRFSIGIFSDKNAMPYEGTFTKTDGINVYKINHTNAYEYFEELGLAKDGLPNNIFYFVPFMVNQIDRKDYDGIPVLRELGLFAPDGTAIFRGNIDEGSTFKLLQGTYDDVMEIAERKFGEAAIQPDINGILIFSCVVRRMLVIQNDSLNELSMAREKMGDIPFMMGYAGGEICPTSVYNDAATNRFHAYSLITLII